MEKQSEDRRVLKTKRQLRQGLAQLMMEKNINRITVKELTDLVDINRATFYTHYQDIYDLTEKIEAELYGQIADIFKGRAPLTHDLDLYPVLRDIFHFIADNAEICQALLGKHRDIAYMRQIENVIRDYFLRNWQLLSPDDHSDKWQYSFAFILSGAMGLLQRWLEGGMPESPDEMALIEANLIKNGVLYRHMLLPEQAAPGTGRKTSTSHT